MVIQLQVVRKAFKDVFLRMMCNLVYFFFSTFRTERTLGTLSNDYGRALVWLKTWSDNTVVIVLKTISLFILRDILRAQFENL